MYYYKIDEDFVIKYKVNVNKEKLEEIRKEIIIFHSKTEIITKKNMIIDNNMKAKYINNYHLLHLHDIIYTDGNTVSFHLYFTYPHLVNLINDLLNEKYTSIDLINSLESDNTFINNEKSSFNTYKKEIINCIELTPIDMISIETLQHVNIFIEDNNNLTINNSLNNLLALQRKKSL